MFSVQEVNVVDEQNYLQFFSCFLELAMSDEVPIYVNGSVSKHYCWVIEACYILHE
jgi:hypothetical protein